jgi:P27 family predicted phage terminase small subunit
MHAPEKEAVKMMGRRSKPTHLKLLEGNRGRRPLNVNEPRPAGDLCDAPHWFSDEQRQSWDYAIKHAPPGLLKLIDRSILTIWVVAEAIHREATKKVEQFGLLSKAPISGVPIQNPYLPIVNKQAQIMAKVAAELGFTPASRSRVSVEPSGGGRSKWDGLIG